MWMVWYLARTGFPCFQIGSRQYNRFFLWCMMPRHTHHQSITKRQNKHELSWCSPSVGDGPLEWCGTLDTIDRKGEFVRVEEACSIIILVCECVWRVRVYRKMPLEIV